MTVTIYTDGSSRGNPGPGGWGAILITDTEVIELGGYEEKTTNNRMELMAAIKGLQAISSWPLAISNTEQNELPKANSQKLTAVEVCTDSEYVKKGMTEWIAGWIKRGWIGSTKKPVLNRDLWESLKKEEERLIALGTHVTWKYVPGHAGVTLNERADVIATSCADSVIDKGATNLQLYRGRKEDYTFF